MRKKRENMKINGRINFIQWIVIALFVIIFCRLFYLNVFMKDYYTMMLNKKNDHYVYGDSAPRGRIYDRNHKLLVDNVAVKSIYYTKKAGIRKEEELVLADKGAKVLELDYGKVSEVNLKDFYIAKYEERTNNLITDEEYEKLENRQLTDNDIYQLKLKRITKEDLDKFSAHEKKVAYLYYLMNKGYYYEEKSIKVGNVSDKEYAYISENSEELKGFNTKLEWERRYLYGDTLKSIFGTISSKETGIPKEEAEYYLSLGYSLDDRVGISGLEKQYESILRGEKSVYEIQEDNTLKLYKEGKKGNDIVLSIDIELQQKIEKMLSEEVMRTKREANTEFYNKSFIVIQEPNTGEVMTMAGKQILEDKRTGKREIVDNSLGNIVSTVTPGSVVKGASILVGYTTGAIKIGTKMYDNCIYLYNLPKKCSWQTLGWVDDIRALAQSSNIYQFKTAMLVGGFNYVPGKKLVIDKQAFHKYRNIFYQVGLGVSTGIDYPREENGYKGTNMAGDLLLNFSIGQYDTYTPLQLSQYVTTIANDGKRVKPHFLKAVLSNEEDGKVLYEVKPVILNTVDADQKYISRVQKGFRAVMTSGTGAYSYIDSKYQPAGKTGTSESFVDVDDDGVVDFETVSNNFVGYAPYNHPVMSILTASPDVQNPKRGNYKSDVNSRITKKATNIFFSLYDTKGKRH